MDLKQLRYFIEVANTRNLTHAAENLFLTQPTLSRTIKLMEQEIGHKLFHYRNKQMLLSRHGQLLYDESKKILNDVEDLYKKLQNLDQETNSVIRIGMATLFSIQFMHQISMFIAKHYETKLEIIQKGSIQIQRMLANDEIDVGLVSLPNYFSNSISISRLDTTTSGYNVYVVMSNKNDLAHKESVKFSDLIDQRFSTLSSDFMLGNMLWNRAKELNFTPNIAMVNDDLHTLLFSILQYDSICLMPIEYKTIADYDDLAWIPLVDDNSFFPIGIALRKDYVPSETMEDLINEIRLN